jgi:hypothetical protein
VVPHHVFSRNAPCLQPLSGSSGPGGCPRQNLTARCLVKIQMRRLPKRRNTSRVYSIRPFAVHVGLDRKSHCQSVSVWILRNSSHDPLPCFGSGFFSNQLIAASSPVSRQILRNRIAAPSGRRYAQGKIAIKKLPLQTRRATQSAIILQSTLRNYGSPSFTAVSALGLIVLSQWTPESVDGHPSRLTDTRVG